MTAENFCYWLKGYLELSECDKNKSNQAHTLSQQQVEEINKHLGYVFSQPIVMPQVPDKIYTSARESTGTSGPSIETLLRGSGTLGVTC